MTIYSQQHISIFCIICVVRGEESASYNLPEKNYCPKARIHYVISYDMITCRPIVYPSTFKGNVFIFLYCCHLISRVKTKSYEIYRNSVYTHRVRYPIAGNCSTVLLECGLFVDLLIFFALGLLLLCRFQASWSLPGMPTILGNSMF